MFSAARPLVVSSARGACRSYAASASAPASAALASSAGWKHTNTTAPVQAIPVVQPVPLLLSSLISKRAQPEDVILLDPTIFAHPLRKDVLHLCVVHHLDALRQGSANTKTRWEVNYSLKKIRPQKGTGGARLGDRGSPMLRGGGVAFGPKPRDFATKLPRKVIQMGMRVALSAKVAERGFGVVKSLDWPGRKTKELVQRLEELEWQKTLFVTGNAEIPDGLRRTTSNLQMAQATTAEQLTVYDAVKWPRIVFDVAAVTWMEQTLSRLAPEERLALEDAALLSPQAAL